MVSSAAKEKPSKSTENMPPKSHYSTHPPWSDMITECITTIPDGTRHGVSRPAIKKFVDSKYHLSMSATTASQLNRAITHGMHSGNFILPKGPSGKVKLAPKRLVTKENKKPKHAMATKIMKPPVSTKTKTPFTEEQPSKTTRKYTSKAKKARVTDLPGRQVPPRQATTQRGGTKRVLTRSRAAAARTKTATRGAAKSKRRAGK